MTVSVKLLQAETGVRVWHKVQVPAGSGEGLAKGSAPGKKDLQAERWVWLIKI